jgi:hypothetical protein
MSNNVLEHEQKVVNEAIAGFKARGATVPDDLTDRQQQIDIRISLLVLQVQTGKLTMEGISKTVMLSSWAISHVRII